MSIESPAISISELDFSYNGVPILEKVDLTIARGDFVSVVGPNGGGKTTLLKLILGLLQPIRGSIRVFGEKPEEARPRVGYMPQHAHLDPRFPVSVMDVVLMGRLGTGRRFGPFGDADRRIARQALGEVRLIDECQKPLSELSGGQKQRVLIARALACDPELLLLDEPTANLDLKVEGEFVQLLKRLNQRMTVMIVSHDLGFVSGFVRSCVCVNRRVRSHPTNQLTGDIIREMYGEEVRVVRHDLHCHKEGSA